MITKGSTADSSGMYTAPSDCTMPRTSAAIKAPAREPRPPTTTTTNESMITSLLMLGDKDKNGAATTPARPARAVPRPTTPALNTSVFTPCMAVVVGSVLDARTNRPILE